MYWQKHKFGVAHGIATF